MTLKKRIIHYGNLVCLELTIARLVLAVGWAKKAPGQKLICINRYVSWGIDRAICLSFFRLRIGFKINPHTGDYSQMPYVA